MSVHVGYMRGKPPGKSWIEIIKGAIKLHRARLGTYPEILFYHPDQEEAVKAAMARVGADLTLAADHRMPGASYIFVCREVNNGL